MKILFQLGYKGSRRSFSTCWFTGEAPLQWTELNPNNAGQYGCWKKGVSIQNSLA